jgi:hypothetical protein
MPGSRGITQQAPRSQPFSPHLLLLPPQARAQSLPGCSPGHPCGYRPGNGSPAGPGNSPTSLLLSQAAVCDTPWPQQRLDQARDAERNPQTFGAIGAFSSLSRSQTGQSKKPASSLKSVGATGKTLLSQGKITYGSPEIRTQDQSVKSRVLYR